MDQKITWPADKVERRALSSLVPYAKNARLHSDEQVKRLVESMREWGWTMPLLVDEGGVIIAGHGRVLAAAQLGMDEAPVMVARGWTEAQIKAYRIADNKLALLSSWDEQLLAMEFDELRELGFGDLSDLTGFTGLEIESLRATEVDPFAEWVGMPEFRQSAKGAFKTIAVHFKDQDAIDGFSEVTRQTVGPNTRFIWYPQIEIERYVDKQYTTAPEAPSSNPELHHRHVQGAGVPGGFYGISNGAKKPFIPSMRECKSIELRHSDVVVDIGAYVGTYSIAAARFPVKRVTAYEPSPYTHGVLSLTRLPNLVTRHAAIVGATSSGEVDFYISHGIGVRSSLTPSMAKDPVRVPAVSYAEAVRGATIVKIDIEGGEYDLPIVQPSLRAIVLEFHPVPKRDWKREAERVMEELRGAGFKAVVPPDFSSGFTHGSSWLRERDDPGDGFDPMLRGEICCGCGAALVSAGGRAICEVCKSIWLPRHQSGYLLARRA